MSTGRRTRSRAISDPVPWIAVAVTLVLRAVYFTQIRDNPYFETPVMDEAYHDGWAREIASGEWAGRLPFFRAPLYPYLLGLAYRLFGPELGVVRGVQLLLGAVTPVLVWAIARRLVPGSRAVAGAAAILVGLDGVLAYFEADLLLESLLAPLGAGLALLLLRAGETGSWRRWLAVGLALGAFAVTRPNVLLFAPVAFVLAAGWRGERFVWRPPRLAPALSVTAGVCLFVLPVTAANWLVGGDRVLVSSQAGLNFFLGNNEEANGWSATAPSLFRIDWWGGYEDAIVLAEEAQGRELLPSEVSRYWFDRAFAWWRENPLDGIGITLRKALFFFSGIEFANNRDLRLFFTEFAPVALPSLGLLAIVMPFSLVGMVVTWRRRSMPARSLVLLVAAYTVSVVAFFVTARYRVPVRPLLFVFACEGARVAWVGVRARGWRGAAPLAAAVALGVALNVNPWLASYEPSAAQFFQSVANVHHERGALRAAFDWQTRALEADPTYPKGNLNLGTLYMAFGDPQSAIGAFERERRLDPDDGENLASLAQAYERTGRTEDAERAYVAAEEAGLEDAPALYNHGLCLERLGRPEEAESLYRRAIAADSTFVEARNNLGVLQARAGSLDEAISSWEKVLELAPGHPRATDNLRRAAELMREEEE